MVSVRLIPVTFYQCDICKAIYSSSEEASQCESRGMAQLIGVGEIVEVRSTAYMGVDLNAKKPMTETYIPAKVTKAFREGHMAFYELEDEVKVTSCNWMGKNINGNPHHSYCNNEFIRQSNPGY